MKLLIVTQKVDINDSVLGFFHRWIEEFAKHCERVTVICLEQGEYNLPPNVKVLSLGKESGRSRLKYLWRFYKYLWQERKNYDSVFVHMNKEYVVLGGLLWRLLSKKIALWYTHKNVNFILRLAILLTNIIFTASKESFRLHTCKLAVMGHGIDTFFFSPNKNISRNDWGLSVGRLMKSKKHDLAIHAAVLSGRKLRIAGEGIEGGNLEILAKNLNAEVIFLGGLTQKELREEYQKADHLIHASETGSLDKVVLEALACGLRVITTNHFFSDLPVAVVSATPELIAQEIVSPSHTDTVSAVSYVREKHSLEGLIPAIIRSIT